MGNTTSLGAPAGNTTAVIVVTVLSAIFVFLILAIRLLIVKWNSYGLDDKVLILAHIAAIGQWICIYVAQGSGGGKPLLVLAEAERFHIQNAIFASHLLLLATLCLSKLSVLLFIRSIFIWERRRRIILVYSSIAIVTFWGIGVIVALSVACSPKAVPGQPSLCPNRLLRIKLITIFDAITELGIFSLPVVFLFDLHMSNSKKLLVIIAFASRLPLCLLSLAYLLSDIYFLENSTSTNSTNPSITPVLIWQEVFIAYSLISPTIPCLKRFVKGFTTRGLDYFKNGECRFTTEDTSQMSWSSRKKSVAELVSHVPSEGLVMAEPFELPADTIPQTVMVDKALPDVATALAKEEEAGIAVC